MGSHATADGPDAKFAQGVNKNLISKTAYRLRELNAK